jgi:hypothetical protein
MAEKVSASAMDNLNASLDNRHKLALPYWARPGIRLVKKGDDDGTGAGGDDGEDDEDDDDEDDEDDDPDADKTPEELRAELAKTRAALKRSNGEDARARRKTKERLAELEKELEEARNGGGDDDKSGKVDEKALSRAVDKAKRDGYNEGVSIGNKRVMNAEARSALVARGASAAKVAKLTSLIDFGELELDDDGVIGLDDAIDELVSDWPELFQTPRPRRIGGKGGRGDRERDDDKKALTATEKQVLALKKGRG